MDDQFFDTLARSVSEPSSRRGLLGGLTALALGLGGAGLPDAATARKKRKHNHNHKKKNTSTTCQPGSESCQGKCLNLCPSGEVRNPLTCGCCQVNMGTCGVYGNDDSCCSGLCAQITAESAVAKLGNACAGRDIAAPCDFSAQCASGFCSPAGVCLFPAS